MRRQDKQRAKEKRKSFLFLLLLLLLRESVLCVSVRACSHLKNVFSVRIKMRQREIRASDFVFRVFTFFFRALFFCRVGERNTPFCLLIR